MNRVVVCAFTVIVAAFEVRAAAAVAGFDDVPVPGGVEALAHALAIDPVPDRGRFIVEASRLLYDTPEFRNAAAAAYLQSVRLRARGKGEARAAARGAQRAGGSGPANVDPDGVDLVPIPLTAQVWSDAIFRRRIGRDEIALAILADRQAALLCHGLAGLDDETLEYFAEHPPLLVRLYERAAPLFAAFGGAIRVRDGHVVPPGGADAVPLWEAVVGEKVTRADRFVLALFDASDGRLSYLYDTIAALDPPRRAFALGLWLPAAARLERFKILAGDGIGGMREWHARVMPFGRSSFDFGMALSRLIVAPDGAPAPPAARGLWARAFGGGGEAADDAPIDAAWLAMNVLAADVRQRGERIDQLSFAQRVFGASASDRAELQYIVRSMSRYRALVLTLERMGMRRPEIYTAALRHAARLSGFDGRRGYVAQAQFQGSLALLARMTSARTLDAARAEPLLERLLALPIADAGGAYAGAVARWLREDLHPALPTARDIEGAIVAGLSGLGDSEGGSVRSTQRVSWEGQSYRLDFAASERNRLQRVRERQHALPIDVPLQLSAAGALLAGGKASPDELRDVVAQLTALDEDLPQRSRVEEADDLPAGVGFGANAHEVLRRAIDELNRALRGRDAKRAGRAAEPLVDLADDFLARSLLSFAYAIHIGDPEGTVLLADDVSHRHDFGFALKDPEMRARLLWAVPRTEVAPGVPWHVSGSLLGLEVGLSNLALRRVATDHALEAPKLTSNARDMFATSVSLMDPLQLRDEDRDAIAAAIDRGERRLAAAIGAAELDAAAAELSLDGRRRRTLQWTHAHEPSRLASLLSLTELLTLGGGRAADLHAWGMAVPAANGCFCSRLQLPGAWTVLAGRPQLGLTAAVLPDVNFRVAILLKELALPAALAKVVLSGAIQDFIDEARPTDDSDWLSLSRAARALTRERVEDYVAAATASGPLMPETERSQGKQP